MKEVELALLVEIACQDHLPGLAKLGHPGRVAWPELFFELLPDLLRQRRTMPGGRHGNLQIDANFQNQTFKHILAPVWLLTYTFGATTYQVVLNGVTGRISGSRPWRTAPPVRQ